MMGTESRNENVAMMLEAEKNHLSLPCMTQALPAAVKANGKV